MLIEQVRGVNKNSFGIVLIILTTLQKNKIDKQLLAEIEKTGVVESIYAPQTVNLRKWLKERCELDNIQFTSKAAIKLIENVKISCEGDEIDFEKVERVIIQNGASIHSLDKVSAGTSMIDEVTTQQD
ncbi:MAG: DUF211 domain-containing protein [Actinobacteria bacterium]|nr:DUF211 domain-containing protein [Actinomycetota bacterium]